MNQKEEYAKEVCLFLAELLRTRKITLQRAAEIAEKVVQNINLIDSEAQFLTLIKDLTAEFTELFYLGERIHMHLGMSQRLLMESQVREFVINFLTRDIALAFNVLQEAVKDSVQTNDLCVKFPPFRQFIETKVWPTR